MKTKDIRFQIRFEKETIRKLKVISKRDGHSVAKLIRQAIKQQYGI